MTGDTKALNPGTVLSTLVLRALAARAGMSRPQTAGQRRIVWEAADVVTDDLASRVLVLNLPAAGRGLGEWLTGAAHLGVPFQATLHQLTTLPVTVSAAVVHICENPAVLRRAAAELGAGSAPAGHRGAALPGLLQARGHHRRQRWRAALSRRLRLAGDRHRQRGHRPPRRPPHGG